MAQEDSKTDKILKFIFGFLDNKINAQSMMELRDKLIADYGVSHEVLAPSAYWGKTESAEDAFRDYRPGRNAVADVAAYNVAVRECAALVGGNFPIACDSAAAVYRETLRRLGYPTHATGLTDLRQMVEMARKKARQTPGAEPAPMAMDTRTATRIAEQSPGLARFLRGAA